MVSHLYKPRQLHIQPNGIEKISEKSASMKDRIKRQKIDNYIPNYQLSIKSIGSFEFYHVDVYII